MVLFSCTLSGNHYAERQIVIPKRHVKTQFGLVHVGSLSSMFGQHIDDLCDSVSGVAYVHSPFS